MSGQQVLIDFIDETLLNTNKRLDEIRKQISSRIDDEVFQAEADVAVIQSIKELFDKGQLTEKRLQDRLKQLREINNDQN